MRLGIFCLFLGLNLLTSASAAEVVVVADAKITAYQTFAEKLQAHLQGSLWQTRRVDDGSDLTPPVAADLVVTTGGDDFAKALRLPGNRPVLATLITRNDYDRLRRTEGSTRRTSAVFLDQPETRQARFIRLLLPQARRVGLLLPPGATAESLRRALQTHQLSTDSETLSQDDQLVSGLAGLLQRTDLLLATPEPAIYKRENIKPILMTSYRYRRPVIAFTPALVRAGALAALHTTPEQAAREVADWILRHGTSLPAPGYPSDFSVTINTAVADALGYNLPDEPTVRRALIAEAGHD